MAIQNSELDFFQIKSQLQTYLKQQSEFQDYDFGASGLSNLLDVLAHNTHINGLIANMAVNESFLSSSQLRSSAVSHAETLGYSPRSKTAATGAVSISLTSTTSPATLTIPKNTEFTGTVDENLYSFFSTEEFSATKDVNDDYVFQTIGGSTELQLKEGRTKTKSFIVGSVNDDSVYVIPDTSIDTSTMEVRVYDNYLSGTFQEYSEINTVSSITDSSRVYIVREASNGYYELFFSDGNVLGTGPAADNRIEVTYISTSGAEANGAQSFSTAYVVDTGIVLNPVMVSPSAGGDGKESIESIKLNAPRTYSAQNRLVTANDYTALISRNYSGYVKDVTAWGGNDNVPPEYGKVFVALNFLTGVSEATKTDVKNQIHSQLTSNLSIMSINTEFVEPRETFLELQTVFNIDTVKTSLPAVSLQNTIDDFIEQYFEDNLTSFDKVFRRSNLLTQIDQLSTAIINSKMSVRIQQRIDMDSIISEIETAKNEFNAVPGVTQLPILTYVEQDHTISFPVLLATPDKDDHIVTSSVFKSNGIDVTIKNELGSTKLQLLDLDGIVKSPNVGYYEPNTATVKLNSLLVDKSGYVGTGIKISATPANQSTISPLRNYIITLDEDFSSTIGYIDIGSSRISL